MHVTRHLPLSLLFALSAWACSSPDPLSGRYVLMAIEERDLPAPVPHTDYQVTSGSLNLSDGSFVMSYAANPGGTIWGSFTTVLKGSYDSRSGPTIEFESSEQSIDGSSPTYVDQSFSGTIQNDSLALTLTDLNQVRWMFRRVDPL